jgi:hypothetical protein
VQGRLVRLRLVRNGPTRFLFAHRDPTSLG